MTRGAVDVFKASWKWIANDEHSIASRLAKRMPVLFDDEAKFGASYRAKDSYTCFNVTTRML